MNEEEPSILLVGTGAMASLFAALLSAHGLKVKMLGSWKESIRVLNNVGVRFIDQDGQESTYPVDATNDPEECAGSRLAIVLVKSYQTADAAKLLTKCLAEDGLALTLQNGLDNDEILADTLGVKRVISGVTTLGATLIGPGTVRMGGLGGISLGYHEGVEIPADFLRQAGFEVEVVEDTRSLVWGKLVINAAINPLTAVLGVKNGELLANLYSRKLMELITIESAEVASALGIELPYSDSVETVEAVAQKTASNYSSMYIDIHRGSLTEIDAINGAIVRVGENIGVPTDYNRMMWLLVKACSENHSLTQDSELQVHR